MRTIKFRGKRIATGEFRYGYYVSNSYGYHFIRSDEDFQTYQIDPETIGQFTGLTDKNGVEIYEGDIVKVRVSNDRFKKNPFFKIGVVKYDDYYGRWDNGYIDRFFSKRMEVLGNIHDNPELLKN